MYIRTIARKNKDGSEVRYVQLAHNYRDKEAGQSRANVLKKDVFFGVANVFNLEVDLIYFDTTSTYFETETVDDFRKHGYSKDRRPDLPQTVIGLAVTREGIPVRCWS